MSEPDPAQPDTPPGAQAPSERAKGDVKAATAWLLANRDRYTESALLEELRASRYTEDEIAAIRAEAARLAPPPAPEAPRRDFRVIAAVITIVAFLGVWAYLSIPWLLPTNEVYFPGPTGAAILGVILALIAFGTLFAIMDSKRLQRGTVGVLVAFLALPFVLLFITAGLCVVTTGQPAY